MNRLASSSKLVLPYICRNRTSPFAFTGNRFEFRGWARVSR